MTELTPSTMLRYYTSENGKHYTAVVLENNRILSLKKAGEKDKTTFKSLDDWLHSIPGTLSISDLHITLSETNLSYNDTITLKDIAPNYDLLRFLLTYESHGLQNSLVRTENTTLRQTQTYVRNENGDLHPVKYNRVKQVLYSEYTGRSGATLKEIGLPSDTDIYVSVPSWFYGKKNRENYIKKMEFPFTRDNYKSFYDAKIAFFVPPFAYIWPDKSYDNNHHYRLVSEYLLEQGYYIFTDNFRYYLKDSIFYQKNFKYLLANIVTVQPIFTELIVSNYNPLGITKIPFKYSDEELLEELKYLVEIN
jgi:hypothetical protein